MCRFLLRKEVIVRKDFAGVGRNLVEKMMT